MNVTIDLFVLLTVVVASHLRMEHRITKVETLLKVIREDK